MSAGVSALVVEFDCDDLTGRSYPGYNLKGRDVLLSARKIGVVALTVGVERLEKRLSLDDTNPNTTHVPP